MQTDDIEKFHNLLNEVAECFDRKPPTAAAIKHWFEAMRPFSWVSVERELQAWLTTKTKFPTIADIRQPLHDKRVSATEQTHGGAQPEEGFDAIVESSLKELGIAKREGEPKELWIERMRMFCKSGIARMQNRMAMKQPMRTREPGDDDEEVAA